MQPLSPAYADPTRDPYESDSGIPTPPATRVAVPQPMPELPDTDAALVHNAVKAATSNAPHLLLAHGIAAPDVDLTPTTPMQQRIDAFKESATMDLHTPEGNAKVAIPFWMNDPNVRPDAARRATKAELSTIALGAGLHPTELGHVLIGRGTPQQIKLVAQALIDAGKLPPPPPDELNDRVRTMMCGYGVGLDCAGYSQQAFLASRGIPRSQTGLKDIDLEDLKGLTGKGFKRVPQSQMREGDLVILGPRPKEQTGHTLIVRSSRLATPEEAAAVAKLAEPGWKSPDPSKLRRVELDSSYGNGGKPEAGGVMRQIFWHDEANNVWLDPAWTINRVDPRDPRVDHMYYGHPIDGVYRPRNEP